MRYYSCKMSTIINLTAKLGDGQVHVTETREWSIPILQSVRDAVLSAVDNGIVVRLTPEKTQELHSLVEQELARQGFQEGTGKNAELIVQAIMTELSYERKELPSKDGTRIYYSRYEAPQHGWINSLDGFPF